jgi:hypothetical protein
LNRDENMKRNTPTAYYTRVLDRMNVTGRVYIICDPKLRESEEVLAITNRFNATVHNGTILQDHLLGRSVNCSRF